MCYRRWTSFFFSRKCFQTPNKCEPRHFFYTRLQQLIFTQFFFLFSFFISTVSTHELFQLTRSSGKKINWLLSSHSSECFWICLHWASRHRFKQRHKFSRCERVSSFHRRAKRHTATGWWMKFTLVWLHFCDDNTILFTVFLRSHMCTRIIIIVSE